MISKEYLRNIVRLQREELSLFDPGIRREALPAIDLSLNHAIVLSGIRRCGKSTLLRQLMEKVKGYYYFNFEDPRAVNFEVSDFERLDEVFREEFGKHSHYFFDEIQNVERWELFVRWLVDTRKHIFITGSNASLLSRELGTRLTGRHLTNEVYPFSFLEFLEIEKMQASEKSLGKFLQVGGFPEYIKTLRPDFLQTLFKDTLTRDVITRHGIRHHKILVELATFLLTNVGKEFTFNSLAKAMALGSVNSVSSFVSYLEDSYLLFTIERFDRSMKKRMRSPKKPYAIDTGMIVRNSVSFSDDSGRLLENAVFVHLKRMYKDDIFYHKGDEECDFVVRKWTDIVQAIQVCLHLTPENQEREYGGLLEAMKSFGLKEGYIITMRQEERLKIDGRTVHIIPAWKWLLTKTPVQ